MKDLKEQIADVIENWRFKKLENIDLDQETDYEIHRETQYYIKSIQEDLEELDGIIDTLVEQMNEPSDFDYDLQADIQARFRDLRGV